MALRSTLTKSDMTIVQRRNIGDRLGCTDRSVPLVFCLVPLLRLRPGFWNRTPTKGLMTGQKGLSTPLPELLSTVVSPVAAVIGTPEVTGSGLLQPKRGAAQATVAGFSAKDANPLKVGFADPPSAQTRETPGLSRAARFPRALKYLSESDPDLFEGGEHGIGVDTKRTGNES